MANAPSRTVLIAAVVLAAAALGICNSLVQRLDPDELKRQEKSDKSAAESAAKAKAADESVARTAQAMGKPGGLALLGADATLGNPAAEHIVEVRWRWTPEVQADPSKVWNPIQAIQQAEPQAKIHVVNEDDSAPDAPTGLFVDGKEIAPAEPDGSIKTDALPHNLGR